MTGGDERCGAVVEVHRHSANGNTTEDTPAGETERAQGWTPEPLKRAGIAIGALPILSFMVMWWFAGNVVWRLTHLPDSAPLVLIFSLAGGVAAGFLSAGGVRAGITSGLLSGLLSLAAFALLLILQASMATAHGASVVIWPIALVYMAYWVLPAVAVGGALGGTIAPGRGAET
ncbi:MAG TPA: hypothetical protein HA263_11565 [Methanoregulaceae archaeon]|nr:hypothetical protein [Methanoregulaceae archaeon]